MHQSRVRRFGILLGSLLAVAACEAGPAMAAPGLPPGYQVQRIDSPIQTAAGGFGNQAVWMGDVDRDGKDDFVVLQFQGSAPQPPPGGTLPPGTQAGAGIIWEFSGATGQVLRSVNAGDNGGVGGNTGADTFLAPMEDIGSCANAPAQAPGQPGPVCASATVGPPDGVREVLVGLGGVDVGGVPDTGRAYVLDGKTLSILKRIDMPAADRQLIAARIAENPTAPSGQANLVRGGFGRTVTSPRGLPPCAGNAGVGDCLPQTVMPTRVRIGDLDGGGVPDIIVGANGFPENGATAHPESHCAKTAGPTTCVQAGRSYIYRGEDIAGKDPSVILDTPVTTLKAISAQTDDPFVPAGRNENFGHSQVPVGDVGACRTGGSFPAVAPGNRCLATSRTTVPDGIPDYVISAHRSDVPIFAPDPAFTETGVSFLYDGATNSILYIYNDPEPVKDALFGFTTGEHFAVGDLGDTTAPDVVLSGFQNASNKAQAGRAYVFSGNFTANFINFATMDDPTPNTFGRFGNPVEGVGDLVGNPQVGNEALVGQFSAVQTPNKEDTNFDVSIMNPANNKALQTVSDPDAQPESGFGSRVFPLGDLNGDGLLDFAVASVRWDRPAEGSNPSVLDAGRIYVFRSDRNALAPGSGAPAAPGGSAGGSTVVPLAGRSVALRASRRRVRRGGRVSLRGVVKAFANPTTCEPGQSVQIQRALGRGRFRTFQTVKTDSKGSFRTRSFKVPRTTLYRARLPKTSRCGSAQSGRARVTVTRSKKKGARKRSR